MKNFIRHAKVKAITTTIVANSKVSDVRNKAKSALSNTHRV